MLDYRRANILIFAGLISIFAVVFGFNRQVQKLQQALSSASAPIGTLAGGL